MVCSQCGMPLKEAEYHPQAACLMFTASRDADVVRASLLAVRAQGLRDAQDMAWQLHKGGRETKTAFHAHEQIRRAADEIETGVAPILGRGRTCRRKARADS